MIGRMHRPSTTSSARRSWRAIATAAVLLSSASVALPASAATTPVSSFDVSGTDAATSTTASPGAPGTTAPGSTIDWILHYRNRTASRAQASLSNPIGGNQRLVPGSLKTPPGLDPRWSADSGGTWQPTEPAQGADAVGATGTQVPGSTGSFAASQQTTTGFDAGNQAGDGYEALFVGDKVFNIHHHYVAGDPANPNGTLIDCHLKSSTGDSPASCPGYPTYVSPVAGQALGTGPKTVTTAQDPVAAVDRATGRLYFPAGLYDGQGSKSVGVACIDVVNSVSCGYTQLGLASLANNPTNRTQINGGAIMGTKLYMVGGEAEIYCFDYAADDGAGGTVAQPCAGQPMAADSTLPIPGSAAGASANDSTVHAFDDRYVFINYFEGTATRERDLICIDTTNTTPSAKLGTPCPGFPIKHYPGGIDHAGGGSFNATTMPVLDASGANVTAVCGEASPAGAAGHPFACFRVTDGAQVTAPWADDGATSVNWRAKGFVETIGPKLYFAKTTPAGVATYTCWDFSLTNPVPGVSGAPCAGFNSATTGKTTRPYTLRQDPEATDCVWVIGDAGVFETFSAEFGGTSCTLTQADVSVDPARYYCDGGTGHVAGWDKLIVDGVTAAQYSGLTVSITDANGAPLPGWTQKAVTPAATSNPDEQTVDISSIASTGSTRALHVSGTFVGLSAGPSTLPTLTLMFAGDPVQVCFKAKVGAACSAAIVVDDSATAVTTGPPGVGDAPGGNWSGMASFNGAVDPTSCRADLSIAKRPDAPEAIPGRPLTYDLVVTNNGPDQAGNAAVTDRLPAGVTFVSASNGCAEVGGSVTCTLPSLASGASHTFQIVVEIGAEVGATLVNTATVASDTTDPIPANNTARSEIPAGPKSDLSIAKTASAATTQPGSQVLYTLVVANGGPSDATGVSVDDPLPAGLSLVGAQPSQGTCTTAGSRLACALGTVKDGGRAQVLVTAQVDASATGSLTNSASVRGAQPDPDMADNSASATVAVAVAVATSPPPPPADLQVVLRADHRTVVGERPIRYTATVTNAGPAAAEDVSVVDTAGLPIRVVSVSTSAGTCTKGMPLRCSLGTMTPGAVTTITFVVTGQRVGALVDTVRVTSRQPDPHTADNLASVTTEVRGTLALRLRAVPARRVATAAAAAIPSVRAGRTVVLRITASNATTLSLRQVRVCARLPAGLAYLRSSPRAKMSRGRLCWTIGSLAGHGSRAYRVTVRALAGAYGKRRSDATATAPFAGTARASATVRVIPRAVRAGGVTG
jgi:uncharacterized repeat protein (TIGR01451 family)